MYQMLLLVIFFNSVYGMDSSKSEAPNERTKLQELLIRKLASTMPVYAKTNTINTNSIIKKFEILGNEVALQTGNGINIHDLATNRCCFTLIKDNIAAFKLYANPARLLIIGNSNLNKHYSINYETGDQYQCKNIPYKDYGILLLWGNFRSMFVRENNNSTACDVYDIDSFKDLGTIEFPPNGDDILFQCAKTKICTADAGTIYLFDMESKNIQEFKGHSDKIVELNADLTKNILYSGSKDSTVRIWDMRNGECLNVFNLPSNSIVESLIVQDNTLSIIHGHKKSINVIDLNNQKEKDVDLSLLSSENNWCRFSFPNKLIFGLQNGIALFDTRFDSKTCSVVSIIKDRKQKTTYVTSDYLDDRDFSIIGAMDDTTLKIYKPLELEQLQFLDDFSTINTTNVPNKLTKLHQILNNKHYKSLPKKARAHIDNLLLQQFEKLTLNK